MEGYHGMIQMMEIPKQIEFLPPTNEVCEGYVFTHVCVHRGHVWQGGLAWQGACLVGGHAWQGACMVGGICGKGNMHSREGACVAGGVGGRGACMAHMPPRQILRLLRTVNERAVRILQECILFLFIFQTKLLTFGHTYLHSNVNNQMYRFITECFWINP